MPKSFNSYVVRLKEDNLDKTYFTSMRFNSYVVRLKGIFNITGKYFYKVSIPMWCD